MFKWIFIMFQWILNVILAFFNLFSATLPLEVYLMKKESGKMFVSGRGEIAITLKVKKPSHVHVFFIDHPVPCDGNKHDKLEYKVHRHIFDRTQLIIKWHVGGVREIEYTYY